jgi:hypothetical protein
MNTTTLSTTILAQEATAAACAGAGLASAKATAVSDPGTASASTGSARAAGEATIEAEITAVEDAIRKLARHPGAVIAAAIGGGVETAFDVIAKASDDALDEACERSFLTERALRSVCGAFLTLRQARRFAELREDAR